MGADFRFPQVLLCAFLQIVLVSVAHAQSVLPDSVIAKAVQGIRLPPASAAKSYGSAPISPALLDLADEAASKSWTPESGRTSKNGVVLDAGQANIVVIAQPGRASELKSRLTQLGGSVEIENEDRIYARLAPQKFQALMDSGLVNSMTPQREHSSNASPSGRTGMVGEGISLAHIEALHRAGLTGKGVKIGVLDLGFYRYEELIRQGELPEPEGFKIFSRRQGKIENVHGTACAEIIHDVAPDAKLVLAQAGPGNGSGATDAEVLAAARWLEAQGVDIISGSFGGIYSANDGSDDIDQMIDAMTQRDKLWVMSAGNEGDDHWGGDVRDDNRNGFVDIPGSPDGDVLVLEKRNRGPLQVLVKWSDWPGQARPGDPQDLDLVLVQVLPDGNGRVVADVRRPRSSTEIEPIDGVSRNDFDAGTYALVLLPSRVTRPLKAHVFVSGARLVNGNASGSIASPGSARQALTVGAVHARTGKLEGYSSQGPTDDERVKPEIVAPANVTSVAYGHAFAGTSASAPHAAGFAALLKQADPGASALQLRQKVIETVRSMGPDSPNNRTGYGLIDGSRWAGGSTPGTSTVVAPGGGSAGQLLAPIQDMLRKR